METTYQGYKTILPSNLDTLHWKSSSARPRSPSMTTSAEATSSRGGKGIINHQTISTLNLMHIAHFVTTHSKEETLYLRPAVDTASQNTADTSPQCPAPPSATPQPRCPSKEKTTSALKMYYKTFTRNLKEIPRYTHFVHHLKRLLAIPLISTRTDCFPS